MKVRFKEKNGKGKIRMVFNCGFRVKIIEKKYPDISDLIDSCCRKHDQACKKCNDEWSKL